MATADPARAGELEQAVLDRFEASFRAAIRQPIRELVEALVATGALAAPSERRARGAKEATR